MDVFKGAISWISFLLLLCGLTTGLLFLLFIALDPQLAGGLGEAIVNLTYGDYPRWLPVAGLSVLLFVAALLALLFAFRKDRHDFEYRLALWFSKIWVEIKLLVIVAVLLVTVLLDFSTTVGGWLTPVAVSLLSLPGHWKEPPVFPPQHHPLPAEGLEQLPGYDYL